MMQVSPVGRALIEKYEGCILRAYQDIVGVWTIAFGHTLGVRPGMVVTQAEADQLLTDDLNSIYGPHVFLLLGGTPTTQPQFDAMVSLAYNVGVGDWLHGRVDRYDSGGFEDSSVRRHHLAGEYEQAADSFGLWVKAGGKTIDGLVRRRAEEASLYLSSLPIVIPPPPPDIHPDLRLGSSGAAVAELQRRLTALGYPCGVADGEYGPLTDGAVEAFQKARKIWPGTVVLGATWNELAVAERERVVT